MSGVDVLAVAAHPDDAEVGCGATLALCAAAGASVAIVDLSAGELSTSGTPELRAREAGAAAAELGVRERICLGLPDGSIGTDRGHREPLVEVFRRLQPRLVLAPYAATDRHPDHAAAGRLARDAAFLGGVRRFGTGEPHRPERIYHYMLHQPFAPTFVVDVTEAWPRRERAVAAYGSQFGGPEHERRTAIGGPDFLAALTARARTHGALIGATYGEAFTCEGPLAVRTLPGLDGPATTLLDYRCYL